MTRARDLAAFVSNADGDIKFDTDTLFIDSSANRVGIGTTTPSRALEISDTSATDVTMRVTNNDGGGELQKNADDLYLNLEDSGNIIVRSGTSITERMRVDNNGNLGIGRTTLTEKFEVNGSINSSNQSANFTTGNYRMNMDIVDSLKLGRIGTIDGASTPSGTEGQVQFLVNATEKMRLTSDGLTFNGDTAAVNALNDYEEGAWTPVDGSGNAYTNSVQASFTKIGRLVYVNFDISSTGSTGGQYISGLPFTAATGTGNWSMYGGYSTSNQDIWGHINPNSNTITMYVGSTAHTLSGRLIGAAVYYA